MAHLIDRSDDSVLAQEQKLSSSDIRRSMLGSYREAQVREGRREGGRGREGAPQICGGACWGVTGKHR